jgi:creatinine amidohydrolase
MRLNDTTWPEVAAMLERGAPVILPLGSLEQHGPHLPFDTDTVCAQAVADGVAEVAGALALPALSFGAPSRPRSGGGTVFPIGAEIPLAAYIDTVSGIVENLLRRGVRNLVATTWHTENAAIVYDAVTAAHARSGIPDARVMVVDSPGSFITRATALRAFVDGPVQGNFEHAGLLETSMMLAIDPARVRPFESVQAALPSLPYDVIPQPAGVVPASGSFTSPRNAAAWIGEAMLADIIPGFAAAMADVFGPSASS